MKHVNKPHLCSKVSISCAVCGTSFFGRTIDKYCSDPCREVINKAQQQSFKAKNPGKMRIYNQNRKTKNPNVWKDKTRRARLKIVALLGGKCLVCKVSNPNWLHVDYIPTMRGTGFRHPRHEKWVITHIADFRLLCANHHYEFTLTGAIKGTTITQA